MGGDLRGDLRANELLTADPGLCGLSGMLQRVAELAQSTGDGLRGTASEGIWSGSAADAFRQGVGRLPDDLVKVTASYQEAGDALSVYAGELNRLDTGHGWLATTFATPQYDVFEKLGLLFDKIAAACRLDPAGVAGG